MYSGLTRRNPSLIDVAVPDHDVLRTARGIVLAVVMGAAIWALLIVGFLALMP